MGWHDDANLALNGHLGKGNDNTVKLNTLRPRQHGRHFADGTFKRIFLNKNVEISIKISLKFVPKGRINNISALVQVMAWRRPGDKPLSEPMVVRLLTWGRETTTQLSLSSSIPVTIWNISQQIAARLLKLAPDCLCWSLKNRHFLFNVF